MTRIKNSKGFTLIELIVVIVIIGILAAIAAVAYNAFINNAEATQVSTSANQIAQVIQGESAFNRGVATAATAGNAAPMAASTVLIGGANIGAAALADINVALTGGIQIAGTAPNTLTVTDGTNSCTIALSDAIGGTNQVNC